jgi:branched-chain amino acid aminotransferase
MEEMEEAILKTIEVNRPMMIGEEDRVLVNITRGLLGLYEDVVGISKGTNIIIAVFPLRWTVCSMGHLFDTGINAVIPSQRAIPAYLLDPKVKNRSRIPYLLANIQVSQVEGKDNWALLIDPDGYITEGTGDNFFIVKNQQVITPEGRNCLRGISRDYIFEICKQLQISCCEKNIDVYDTLCSDEAFMTGTPFCLLPVTKLNGQNIGSGKPGEITKLLLNRWSENVGVDVETQIKSYASSKKPTGITPYSFKVSK